MKKYLALLLGVVLVLGFAASAFAIHAEIPAETQAVVAKSQTQITLGGELRFRGAYFDNTNDFNNKKTTAATTLGGGAAQAEGSYYDMRIRLSLEAKVTPNTMGLVQVESGTGNNNENVIWGNGLSGTGAITDNGAKGVYRQGNTKKGSMEILQAWILHQGSGLLGIPAYVKVGHMPVKLGNGLFYDHSYWGDDAILAGITPIKGLDITLATIKDYEGSITLNDDHTAYSIIAAYAIDKNTSVSADVTYLDAQNVGETSSPANASFPNVHLWNFAIRGNTEFMGLGLWADAEMQAGKADKFVNATNNNPKLSGYVINAGIYYKIAPVKLSAEFLYGSGDNKADNKVKMFVTSHGQEQNYTFVYDYLAPSAAGQFRSGVANTTYLKIGADVNIMKDLSGLVNVYFLQATKKNYGSPETALLFGTPNIATSSKNIGTEVDGKLTYIIDRNLQWWVEGGILFAGKYWDNVTNAAGLGTKHDNAYAVRHGILLAF